MSAPPNRTDLAGTPTVATYKLAIGLLYDYVASLLGNGTATNATTSEKKLARESLGVGTTSYKNKFINPAFAIDQDFSGGSISVPISATPKYLVDQWYALTTGAAISAQRIAGIADQKYSLRLTGATSNTAVTLGQRIEAENCGDLKNKNVTVSLKSKASSARVVTWFASYATVSDTFTTTTQIATGTINVTTLTTDFQFSFNAGANVGNGLEIEFSTTSLLTGATIDFDQMQIEESSIATEFQSRPIQQELTLCQRYYQDGQVRWDGYVGATNVGFTSPIYFLAEMRVSPTIAQTNVSAASFTTTVGLFNLSKKGFFDKRTSSAVGNGAWITTWTASARL